MITNNKLDVWAGIVSYNPQINRLKKNIEAIYQQVAKVVLVDNGSNNLDEVVALCNNFNVVYILNSENKGIAAALNQLMQYAYDYGIKWVITLDQDSICPNSIILEANSLLERNDIGQIVPLLFESNAKEFCYLGNIPNGKKFQQVNKSITSASINSVDIWKKVQGFDEKLFIDYVDYDYAMRLFIGKYKIIRMNDIILDHQIGQSINKKLFFFNVRVGNHSSFRKYYISRNMVIYICRYYKYINILPEMLRLFKVFILIILFENEKRLKLKQFFKGIKDGIKNLSD